MLLDILIALLLLILLGLVVVAAICAYSVLPLSDIVNALLRRVGLAGPSPESRAVGVHALGTVDGGFTIRDGEDVGVGRVVVKGEIWDAVCSSGLAPSLSEGDTVDIVYNDDLTVTVVGKSRRTIDAHPSSTQGAT